MILKMIPQFVTPFRAIVAGPSLAGKTNFVLNLIKNREKIFDGAAIHEIIWCCKNISFIPLELKNEPNVRIYEGIISLEELKPDTLLIIDDLMNNLSIEVSDIFSVHSHHKRISVILIVQNLFHNDKYMRNCSLNSNYFILMRNPRFESQFDYFARQISSGNWRNLRKVYNTVCSQPYTPFIIDLTQKVSEINKYKSNIFNEGYYEAFATEQDLIKCCKDSFITDEKDKVLVFIPAQ